MIEDLLCWDIIIEHLIKGVELLRSRIHNSLVGYFLPELASGCCVVFLDEGFDPDRDVDLFFLLHVGKAVTLFLLKIKNLKL